MKEIEITKNLKHKNVISSIDSFEDDAHGKIY